MKENKYINNEQDNFNKLIKDKLQGHKLEVEQDWLIEIEKRLNRNKRKSIPL